MIVEILDFPLDFCTVYADDDITRERVDVFVGVASLHVEAEGTRVMTQEVVGNAYYLCVVAVYVIILGAVAQSLALRWQRYSSH